MSSERDSKIALLTSVDQIRFRVVPGVYYCCLYSQGLHEHALERVWLYLVVQCELWMLSLDDYGREPIIFRGFQRCRVLLS